MTSNSASRKDRHGASPKMSRLLIGRGISHLAVRETASASNVASLGRPRKHASLRNQSPCVAHPSEPKKQVVNKATPLSPATDLDLPGELQADLASCSSSLTQAGCKGSNQNSKGPSDDLNRQFPPELASMLGDQVLQLKLSRVSVEFSSEVAPELRPVSNALKHYRDMHVPSPVVERSLNLDHDVGIQLVSKACRAPATYATHLSKQKICTVSRSAPSSSVRRFSRPSKRRADKSVPNASVLPMLPNASNASVDPQRKQKPDQEVKDFGFSEQPKQHDGDGIPPTLAARPNQARRRHVDQGGPPSFVTRPVLLKHGHDRPKKRPGRRMRQFGRSKDCSVILKRLSGDTLVPSAEDCERTAKVQTQLVHSSQNKNNPGSDVDSPTKDQKVEKKTESRDCFGLPNKCDIQGTCSSPVAHPSHLQKCHIDQGIASPAVTRISSHGKHLADSGGKSSPVARLGGAKKRLAKQNKLSPRVERTGQSGRSQVGLVTSPLVARIGRRIESHVGEGISCLPYQPQKLCTRAAVVLVKPLKYPYDASVSSSNVAVKPQTIGEKPDQEARDSVFFEQGKQRDDDSTSSSLLARPSQPRQLHDGQGSTSSSASRRFIPKNRHGLPKKRHGERTKPFARPKTRSIILESLSSPDSLVCSVDSCRQIAKDQQQVNNSSQEITSEHASGSDIGPLPKDHMTDQKIDRKMKSRDFLRLPKKCDVQSSCPSLAHPSETEERRPDQDTASSAVARSGSAAKRLANSGGTSSAPARLSLLRKRSSYEDEPFSHSEHTGQPHNCKFDLAIRSSPVTSLEGPVESHRVQSNSCSPDQHEKVADLCIETVEAQVPLLKYPCVTTPESSPIFAVDPQMTKQEPDQDTRDPGFLGEPKQRDGHDIPSSLAVQPSQPGKRDVDQCDLSLSVPRPLPLKRRPGRPKKRRFPTQWRFAREVERCVIRESSSSTDKSECAVECPEQTANNQPSETNSTLQTSSEHTLDTSVCSLQMSRNTDQETKGSDIPMQPKQYLLPWTSVSQEAKQEPVSIIAVSTQTSHPTDQKTEGSGFLDGPNKCNVQVISSTPAKHLIRVTKCLVDKDTPSSRVECPSQPGNRQVDLDTPSSTGHLGHPKKPFEPDQDTRDPGFLGEPKQRDGHDIPSSLAVQPSQPGKRDVDQCDLSLSAPRPLPLKRRPGRPKKRRFPTQWRFAREVERCVIRESSSSTDKSECAVECPEQTANNQPSETNSTLQTSSEHTLDTSVCSLQMGRNTDQETKGSDIPMQPKQYLLPWTSVSQEAKQEPVSIIAVSTQTSHPTDQKTEGSGFLGGPNKCNVQVISSTPVKHLIRVTKCLVDKDTPSSRVECPSQPGNRQVDLDTPSSTGHLGHPKKPFGGQGYPCLSNQPEKYDDHRGIAMDVQQPILKLSVESLSKPSSGFVLSPEPNKQQISHPTKVPEADRDKRLSSAQTSCLGGQVVQVKIWPVAVELGLELASVARIRARASNPTASSAKQPVLQSDRDRPVQARQRSTQSPAEQTTLHQAACRPASIGQPAAQPGPRPSEGQEPALMSDGPEPFRLDEDREPFWMGRRSSTSTCDFEGFAEEGLDRTHKVGPNAFNRLLRMKEPSPDQGTVEVQRVMPSMEEPSELPTGPRLGAVALRCDHCNFESLNRPLFERHVRRQHGRFGGNGKHKCDSCEYSSNLIAAMKRHYLVHTGERPFPCAVCGKRFAQTSARNTHALIHTNEKPYKCEMCESSFRAGYQLNAHRKNSHTSEMPYRCDLCGMSFRFQSRLNTHTQKHTGEKPYRCTLCGDCFNSPTSLVTHIRTHTGEKPYRCDYCGKAFASKGVLREHALIHIEGRGFNCSYCFRAFKVKKNMLAHMIIHTGERRFACDFCGKAFLRRASLTVHVRTHTRERLFTCETCGKSFSEKKLLRSHLRIHTDEKPYLCETCGWLFREKGNLISHVKHVHSSVQNRRNRPAKATVKKQNV